MMHADGATAGTCLIDDGETRRLVFVQLLAPCLDRLLQPTARGGRAHDLRNADL